LEGNYCKKNINANTEHVTNLDKQIGMFILSQFLPLLNQASFIEATGAVVQIG